MLEKLQLGDVVPAGLKSCAKACKSVLVNSAWAGLYYSHIGVVVPGAARKGQTVGVDFSVDGEDPRHRRAPPWSVRWAPTPGHTMP